MKQTSQPSDETDHDAQLVRVLDELTEAFRRGHSPDFNAVARQYPHLADELRSLWTAALIADCVAVGERSQAHNERPSSSADEPTIPQSDAQRASAAQKGLSPPLSPGFGESPGPLPRGFGDYELLEELGRGGMGVVYKARQISLNRIVALKVVLRGELASQADLARFASEAQSAARLDHPHIVPVYEVGDHAGRPYFTMKYVAGTTLAERLAEGPITAREAAALLAPVCRAIHYAHQRGVLHRDLKPSNILIDKEGRPHVSDFGLAKRVEGNDQLTISGAIIGTPSHMAPEQAAGSRGRLGPASDVYSLGTILYQMLTGRPPFQAATPLNTVLLLLEQEPLPPRLLNPRANRELEMIALKCLQKPPELRYATADALANDLQAFLADEPIAARSGLFHQVLARWLRETHHATVLENWGLLWMWHSLALLIVSLLTNALQWRGVASPAPYAALWTVGLGTWAAIFWALRHRAGPVTFVERQIAHVWAASVISIALLFLIEIIMKLPVLTLSPVLALSSGMVFLVKAGILSGRFYGESAALFATAGAMALLQRYDIPLGITLFGVVSAACFFFPGLKYYRQRQASLHE